MFKNKILLTVFALVFMIGVSGGGYYMIGEITAENSRSRSDTELSNKLWEDFSREVVGEKKAPTAGKRQSGANRQIGEDMDYTNEFADEVEKKLGSPPSERFLQKLWEESNSPADTLPQLPKFRLITPDPVKVSVEGLPVIEAQSYSGPLKDILSFWAEHFGYNLDIRQGVELDRRVVFNASAVNLAEALELALAQTDYAFQITENKITIQAEITRMLQVYWPDVSVSFSSEVRRGAGGGDLADASAEGSSSMEQSLAGNRIWDDIDRFLRSRLGRNQAEYTLSPHLGSVIVQGPPSIVRNTIEALANQMQDHLGQQVHVTAHFMEASLGESDRFGINWDQLADVGSLGQFTATTELGATGAGELGGVSIRFDSSKSDHVLRALRDEADISTISRPSTIVNNRGVAQVVLEETRRYISTVTQSISSDGNIISSSPQQESVSEGIAVSFLPVIMGHDRIHLNLSTIAQEVREIVERTPSEDITVQLPAQNQRLFSTTASLRDGESVIFGGMISSRSSDRQHKVPVLGSIPYIGGLFRGYETEESKVELVLMISVDIIRNPIDIEVTTL